jgi:hypothetical protein
MGTRCKFRFRDMGAPVENRKVSDFIPKNSVMDNPTYDHFLEYMNPIAIEWWEIDKSYTHPDSSPSYPNKTFLEVINFKKSL